MARRRRRRAAPSRRRRRYYRNPSFGLRGLKLKEAAFIVVGAAAAKFIAAKLPANITADPKMKGLATLGIGLALGMVPRVPREIGLGGQVAGITSLLASFAPQYFGAVEAGDPGLAGYGQEEMYDELPGMAGALGEIGAEEYATV